VVQRILEAARSAADQEEWELALLHLATACEAFVGLSAPLVEFRRTYTSFMRCEDLKKIQDFHDAVGVHLPRVTDCGLIDADSARTQPVDLIVPVHNGLEHLMPCLESLHQNLSSSIRRIVIVDDGSDTETRAFIRAYEKKTANCLSCRNDDSLGFTRAVKRGLGVSESSHFIVLNSDTVVYEGWVDKLLAAACGSPDIGLIGPVSNAAAWQNVTEPLDPDGNFLRGEMLSSVDVQAVQICAARSTSYANPYSPLVHGFCVMVNRDAYDAVGGLDEASFPRGYGEFQDLSIRLWDAGFKGKIVTECFVAHAGAGSLPLAQRAELSIAGRSKLYEKHTALRYLTFEASSIYSLPMKMFREGVSSMLASG
jgi:GT2 family glycosyltransferase